MCSSISSAASSFTNDPVGYAIAAKQNATADQVSIGVLALSQQSTKQEGEAMVALIQSAASLGKEAGKGTQFDATA